MAEALMQPCAAAESTTARGVRYAAGAALVLCALAQCAMACVMLAKQIEPPQVLYLLCALALLAATVIAVRERRRGLIAVRVLAIAAAVMLLWSISANASPSVTVRGHLQDLTPMLLAMLLAAVLLPSLMRERDSEAACNCG